MFLAYLVGFGFVSAYWWLVASYVGGVVLVVIRGFLDTCVWCDCVIYAPGVLMRVGFGLCVWGFRVCVLFCMEWFSVWVPLRLVIGDWLLGLRAGWVSVWLCVFLPKRRLWGGLLCGVCLRLFWFWF